MSRKKPSPVRTITEPIISLPAAIRFEEDEATIELSSGEEIAVYPELASICREADQFRTVEGHVRHLVEIGWPEERVSWILSGLDILRECGLLVTKSELLAKVRDRADAIQTHSVGTTSIVSSPEISTQVWITCERPAALRRSLEGFIRNARSHDRRPAYVVFDDSHRAGLAEQTRRGVAETANEERVEISYVGLQEKERFAEALKVRAATTKMPSEIVDFALFDPEGFGLSIGANRNAVLLFLPNRLILSSDDDAVARVASSDRQEEGVAFSSAYSSSEGEVFSNRDALWAVNDAGRVDHLGVHESLLGRSISACLQELAPGNDAVNVEWMSPTFATALLNQDANVLVTGSGVSGDSGTGSPKYLLTLRDEERDRIVADGDLYQVAKRSREVLRVAKRYTISEGFFVGGFFLGLDNREILPPFIPVGRNEDVIFASTLRMCFPSAYIGHIPWAFGHEPAEERRFGPDDMFDVMPKANELISVLMSRVQMPKDELPTARFKHLGVALTDAARRPPSEFLDHLLEGWIRQTEWMIDLLEALLAEYGGRPDYWAEDVHRFIDSLALLIANPYTIAPSDFVAEDRQKKMERFRLLAYRFGELLYWWPELTECADRAVADGFGVVGPTQ